VQIRRRPEFGVKVLTANPLWRCDAQTISTSFHGRPDAPPIPAHEAPEPGAFFVSHPGMEVIAVLGSQLDNGIAILDSRSATHTNG